jgi:uncharacterized protein (DUF1501 family)
MINRRKFLEHSAQAVGIPILLNGLPLSAIARSTLFGGLNTHSDRILVLIELNGGNDGLNMLIPVDQYDDLMQVRGNLVLPESSLLSITDLNALHPSMLDIQQLYQEGGIGFIQNVGYPDQNRSHFRSADVWATASPSNEIWTSGWLGRHLDTLYPGFPDGYPNEDQPHPFAIAMGNAQVSSTCQGFSANYTLAMKDIDSLGQVIEGETDVLPQITYGQELSFLRTTIAQSNAYASAVEEAAGMGANIVDYPDSRLAGLLKNVAQLISGGMQTQIYVLRIGGFDTHVDQVEENDTVNGSHAVLLHEISEAVGAFTADIEALGLSDRVLGMTFSEFGRRIRSNGSLGTDHGTAAPLMLFGSCVQSQVYGDNPEINTDIDLLEGVQMQFDFRDVYGTILTNWLGAEEQVVRDSLYPDFVMLPILNNCLLVDTKDPAIQTDLEMSVFPNPMGNVGHIRFFSENAWVKLSVFDTLGAEIKVLMNRTIPSGEHQVRWESNDLPSGVYFVRLQIGPVVKTKRVVKH